MRIPDPVTPGMQAAQEAADKAYYGEKANTCSVAGSIRQPSAYETTLRGQLYEKREALLVQLREIDECLENLNDVSVRKVLRVMSVAQ